MNSLFENAGSTIKKLACIVLILSILASLVCAIVFGKDRYGDFNFWAFLGILAGGALGGFISSLFLYAFGDITENIKAMAAASAETAKAAKATAKATEATSGTASKPVSYSNSHAKVSSMGDWVCKKCGTRNDKSAMYGKDCGEYK